MCIKIDIKLSFSFVMVSFTTDIASSSDVSTIGNPSKNRRVTSVADANTGDSESCDTPNSTEIATSADDQVCRNAPSTIDITATDGAPTNMEASSSIDVTTSADDQANTNAPDNIDITASASAPSSMDASVKPTILMFTRKVPTSTAGVKTTSPTPIARDCSDILDQGYTESYDIYHIQPSSDSKSFDVICDLETNGKEWIVLQRRFDGSLDFYLPWEDYKNGLVTLPVNTGWVLRNYTG